MELSLEEYFALNASVECVFRDFRSRFKSGPVHIITVELVAGLNPPEFKIKVSTVLDIKGGWKKDPDFVYSVVREAAEAWVTVEPADKLRRVQSHPKAAVERVGSDKEEKGEVVERVGQGMNPRSGDSKPSGSCWNCVRRVTESPIAQPSGSRGP